MSKVSDYFVSVPGRITDIGGIVAIDRIGEYMKTQINKLYNEPVPGPPPSPLYVAENTPYASKIKADLESYADTLQTEEVETTSDDGKVTVSYTRDDGADIKAALQDATSGLSKLVAALETQFTIDQNTAVIQFNVPVPPANTTTIGTTPPYAYIPGTYLAAITTVFILPTAIDMATAFETFIAAQYVSGGTT